MATYICLVNFTAKGIESIKDGAARLEVAKQGLKALGGELRGWYLTMGHYDVLFIFDAPDDATAAKGILTLTAQGNVRTETMRAFTEDEYRAILASMP